MNNVVPGTLAHRLALVCVSIAPTALGAPEPPTATVDQGPTVEHRADGGRPARTGFQMALRTGLAFPSGNATAAPGDSLARRYSKQWPLHLDLGAKVTEHVYLGGYFAFAFGAEGNDAAISEYCNDDDSNLENDISCSAHSVRFGVQAQYHFLPDEGTNPWLGYGVGIESTTQRLLDEPRGYDEQTTTTGITYAKLDAGLDFRLRVGLGLYAEAAIGRFTDSSTEVNGRKVYDGAIDERAWHMWLTTGARLVIFP